MLRYIDLYTLSHYPHVLLRFFLFPQIVIYVLYVLPNIWRVLKHYESIGAIELQMLTPAGNLPTHAALLDEYFRYFDESSWIVFS